MLLSVDIVAPRDPVFHFRRPFRAHRIMINNSRPAGRRDIERFLRVDHAGERAAQQIYRGQLAILRN